MAFQGNSLPKRSGRSSAVRGTSGPRASLATLPRRATGKGAKQEAKPEPGNEALLKKAVEQSPKLAALLTLSIGLSRGPHCSIVTEELRVYKNGVMAWAKLIQHFEQSTKDLRLDSLLQKWGKLANVYIHVGEFEQARNMFEEAIDDVMTVKDFA